MPNRSPEEGGPQTTPGFPPCSRPLGAPKLALIKALLLSALLAHTLSAAPPADYYAAAEKLSGEELQKALHDLIDDHRIIKYKATRPAMAALHEDPKNPANLIQIYTQKSVPKDRNDLWNREHLWPRSRGNTDHQGPDDSDLHHLFPSDYQVNNDRASLLFDISKPARPAAHWSIDADSFQPPAAAVGDVARALFYMAVRYDGSDRQTSDLSLVSSDFNGAEMGHLSVLLAWHTADPPDDFERRRNDLIFATYQGNRNPFVDRPEFVAAIWGPAPGEVRLPSFPSASQSGRVLECEESSSSLSSQPSAPVPIEEPQPAPPKGASPQAR